MLSKSLTRRTHLHLFVDVILILSSRFIFLSISFYTTNIQESKFKTIWRHFFYTQFTIQEIGRGCADQ